MQHVMRRGAYGLLMHATLQSLADVAEPPVQAVIDAGVVPHLVAILTKEGEPSVVKVGGRGVYTSFEPCCCSFHAVSACVVRRACSHVALLRGGGCREMQRGRCPTSPLAPRSKQLRWCGVVRCQLS